MISFEYLNKSDFPTLAHTIFDILADNMTLIAPTGNSREDDFDIWFDAVSQGLEPSERQIILIKDDENIIGFSQYYTNSDTFMMEEVQFKAAYQGKGISRKLLEFVLENINSDLRFVGAYANVKNNRSIAILSKLGLKNIGLNKNGNSYRFQGKFTDLIKWYESK